MSFINSIIKALLETNPRRRKALPYLTKIKTLKTASALSHDEIKLELLSLKKQSKQREQVLMLKLQL
jgi:hypothetical protein